MRPCEPMRRDYLLALLLFALSVAALGLAQRDQGVMRDEGTYFRASESYWGWFAHLADNISDGKTGKSFDRKEIHRYWRNNGEHPVLVKTLSALSWRFLHERARNKRGFESAALMSEISAFRVPGWLFTGLAVALLYLFGLRIGGRACGLSAALLYITIPRVFFHGQLACFDSPITTMWLLVCYGYFRSLSGEKKRWAIYTGVFFGLALATKHNAWFLPPLLLIHYLAVVWPDLSLRPLRLPRVALVFIAMAVLGVLVFWAHWPMLWTDPIKHLRWYFGFHARHSFYNMEYLGVNWGYPPLPLSYPFVMTLFTVPTITVLLSLAGLWHYISATVLTVLSRWTGIVAPKRHDDPWRYPAKRSWVRPAQGLNPRIGLLLVINASFPLLLIALPWTPIFGGTKHWMPAYPFIALLGGVAVARLLERLRAIGRARAEANASPQSSRAGASARPVKGWVRVMAVLLPIAIAAPGAVNTWLTHPFGLSQYNALAGGVAGAADLGLNRQFWGYSPRQLLPWINKTLPKSANVYWHDVSYDAYRAYINDGLLRPDIHNAGAEQPAINASNFAMVIHELHFNKYDYMIWRTYGHPAPVKVLSLDGVPLVSVYDRKRAATLRRPLSQRDRKP
ncbi:MAG: glycosyltransferase family 39 protein [Myxococcales bacterium]|nr:glycosyltransferase family 39 protein [Myxococcales bacterium]